MNVTITKLTSLKARQRYEKKSGIAHRRSVLLSYLPHTSVSRRDLHSDLCRYEPTTLTQNHRTMKKPLLLFAALAAAAAPLSSDNPEKTPATVRSPKRITGSRAGLNAAWTTAKAEGISANTPNFSVGSYRTFRRSSYGTAFRGNSLCFRVRRKMLRQIGRYAPLRPRLRIEPAPHGGTSISDSDTRKD